MSATILQFPVPASVPPRRSWWTRVQIRAACVFMIQTLKVDCWLSWTSTLLQGLIEEPTPRHMRAWVRAMWLINPSTPTERRLAIADWLEARMDDPVIGSAV